MLSNTLPKANNILISAPFLKDPNFERSVIYLSEHSESGSMGFILNHPFGVKLNTVIPDLYSCEMEVFYGGPVAIDTLHFLHNCFDRLKSGEKIGEGIYWGGDFDTLKLLLNNNLIQEHEIKFFLGYAGWSENQLQTEIEDNTWIVSDKVYKDWIYSKNPEYLWRDMLIELGPKYAHVGQFPKDPNLN